MPGLTAVYGEQEQIDVVDAGVDVYKRQEECKKRNANIKPNVLSILEKERQNLIEKKAHDAKLNPFK